MSMRARPHISIWPLFVLIWASLMLFCVGIWAQSGTPIANLTRTNLVVGTNILPVVIFPGQTNGTYGINLSNLLHSLTNLSTWPPSGQASVTNAIGSVSTNGTLVTSAATSLNIVQGSNTLVLVTNSSGAVSVQINAIASAVGSTNVYTNVTFVNATSSNAFTNGVSLTNAYLAARVGSVIVVGPGDYSLGTNNPGSPLSRGGVDMYFMPGSKLTSYGDSIFDDTGGAITNRIMGYGDFAITNSNTPNLVSISDPNSDFTFEHNNVTAIGAGAVCFVHEGGRMTLLTRGLAKTDTYDVMIAGGVNVQSLDWKCSRVDAGGDIFEGSADGYPVGGANLWIGYGRGNIAGGGFIKLCKNVHIRFGTLESVGTGGNGTVENYGTGYGILDGGLILRTNTSATAVIGSPTSANSSVHLRNCTIRGSDTHDLILVTNYSTAYPLILENCTVFPGASSTNLARTLTSPAYVEIRGMLSMTPFKPISATMLGTNLEPNILSSTIISGTTLATNFARAGSIDVPTNAHVATLRVTNTATIGTLSVSGGGSVVGDFDAGTLTSIGNAGVGNYLNLGTLADALIMADHEGYVTNVTIGPGLSLSGTTLAANGVLTNLVATVGRNVTNFVSLSTTNATSKPLTNSYTSGVLTMFGLEAGANVTLTPNASNIVIAASGGSATTNFNTASFNSLEVSNIVQIAQIEVRSNAFVSALRVTNGLTHSSWMSGSGNYTNTGNIRSSGGTVSSFNGSDYVALDASVSALRTSFDPLTIAYQDTSIAGWRTNMSLIYSNLGIRGTNFVGTLALPNVATNKILMTGGGSNVVAATVGSGLSFSGGTLSASGGGSGGTNFPPAINLWGGTNVAISTGVRQFVTLTTNASFALNFQGAPLNGENVRVGVSNFASATIYLTNFAGGAIANCFDPYVGSNVTTFPILGTSIRFFDFVWHTNFNLGTVRQELHWSSELQPSLAVASSNPVGNLSLHTNAAGSVITISNAATLLAVEPAGYGAALASDGANAVWSFGTPNGRWVIDEEFHWTADAAGDRGRESWSRSTAGTINLGQYGPPPAFGVLSINNRTSGSRWAQAIGTAPVSTGTTSFTNAQVLCLTRVLMSSTNSATDGTNTFRIGYGDQINAEFSNGIYWRTTNNVWELVTARSGTRTVSTTTSNLLANVWIDLAWRLDSTGTNVIGYIGTSATNMAPVATNSLNIPHDTGSQPVVYSHMIISNATAGVTNFVDYFKVWAKHQ